MKYLHNRLIVLSIFIFSAFFIISCDNKPTDEQIQQNISTKLQNEPAMAKISATVTDGVVILTGNCEGDDCKTKAESMVQEVEGVQSVENNIQQDTSTDLTLRSSVQSIISKYEGVQADVAAGNIVLRGSISRDQVQPMMNELEALEAKSIDNQLVVK